MTARPGAREGRAGPSRTVHVRLGLLVAGVALFSAALAWRLYVIQVVRADALRARAEDQQRQVIKLGGQRGSILDRRGRELAGSEAGWSVGVYPPRLKDAPAAARRLAQALGVPESFVRERLAIKRSFVWVKRRVDQAAMLRVRASIPRGQEQAYDIRSEPRRVYPNGPLAAHVLGFTSYATEVMEGSGGIEARFEETLRSEADEYLAEYDVHRRPVLRLIRPSTKAAGDVILTIDLVLQHIVERELDRVMRETRAEAATAILIEPSTGHVLALANRPTADPNALGRSSLDAWRNRAVTDQYEPGSTFKVITASTALDQGTVSPDTWFDCQNGSIRIANHRIEDVHPYGMLTLRGVLEHSSNVGIIKVGRTLTHNAFYDSVRRFGFGERSGIELPGEVPGLVNKVSTWSALSAPSLSMGYEVGVTPLQVASAIATLGHDGVRVPPRIVLGTRAPDGTFTPSPAPEARRVISSSAARTMASILEGVLLRGTGKLAVVPGYRMAGKTGTARKVIPGQGYSPSKKIGSFTGFGPVRDPRLAALVIVDSPRGEYYGGQVAAPAFARIMADALAYLRVPPDEDPLRHEPAAATPGVQRASARRDLPPRPAEPEEPFRRTPTIPGQVPDVRGLPLRDAVAALAARGCTARSLGPGRIGRQEPPPGFPASAGMVVLLTPGDPREDAEETEVAAAEPPRPAPAPRARRRG